MFINNNHCISIPWIYIVCNHIMPPTLLRKDGSTLSSRCVLNSNCTASLYFEDRSLAEILIPSAICFLLIHAHMGKSACVCECVYGFEVYKDDIFLVTSTQSWCAEWPTVLFYSPSPIAVIVLTCICTTVTYREKEKEKTKHWDPKSEWLFTLFCFK